MILFINGSINSGKSTVAKLIAERLDNTAVIEVDEVRHFITWMPLEQAIPITLKNVCSLVKNYHSHGLHVVVPYPLSQENYDYISAQLFDLPGMYFFTLSPKQEIALKNRGKRELSEQERARILHHYEKGIHKPTFGMTIDNSTQTPEQTVEEIMSSIS